MIKLSILHIPSGDIILTEGILSLDIKSAADEYSAAIHYLCAPVEHETNNLKNLYAQLARLNSTFDGYSTPMWINCLSTYIQTHSNNFPVKTPFYGSSYVDWGKIIPEEFELLSIIEI